MGKPDFVFRKARLACFVDVDGQHSVQRRRSALIKSPEEHLARQSTKRDAQLKKIHANIQRDIRNTAKLIEQGWGVVRFWASEVENAPDKCAAKIAEMCKAEIRPSPISSAAAATAADFFAGIGLMRLGLRRAGWRTVWANDFDPTKRKFYQHNLAGENGILLDSRPISQVTVSDVPSVGIVSACFPCTDLSLAGEGRGLEDGKQSSAYLRFAELLAGLGSRRPPFVVLENVLGLIHNRNGKDFRICLERLASAGYRIDAVKIDAAHFVPQSRPRLFILGIRNNIVIDPIVDESLDLPDPFRPARLQASIRANKDLPWSIRSLPPLPRRTVWLEDILDDFDSSSSDWWVGDRVRRLQEQVFDRHHERMKELIAERGVVWATAFRRMRDGRSMAELRFDGIAGCLRTPKGGSAKQILIRADSKGWLVRLLSVRECARLMGADEFRTDAEGVTKDNALFGFGDAVCVPVVEWLIQNYVNPIMAELLRGPLLKLKAER